MSKIVLKTILIGLLAAISGLTACASHQQDTVEKDKQVVLLFDSPIAYDAFSISCMKGAEIAKKQYGIKLTFNEAGTYDEAANTLKQLAGSGNYDLIISIGANQAAEVKKAAAKYTRQKMASVDGNIADLPNVISLIARDNESSYLAGALAAMMTKSGTIGFIGGMDIPSIHRFLAGYQAGAQSIKPECKILIDYSGNWINDGTSKALALQQIKEGADILFGPAGSGNLGVIEAAKEKGLYALGVDADQSPTAPQTVIASTTKNEDSLVYEAISQLVEDRFKGGIVSVGLSEGGVGIAVNDSISAMTPEIRTRLADIEYQIISGAITVPESN